MILASLVIDDTSLTRISTLPTLVRNIVLIFEKAALTPTGDNGGRAVLSRSVPPLETEDGLGQFGELMAIAERRHSMTMSRGLRLTSQEVEKAPFHDNQHLHWPD